VAAKRQADYLRRARRKQWRAQRLREPLGKTVRRRVRAVEWYLACRPAQTERQAARQVAAHFQISLPTLRRWARLYRQGGRAALLPKPPGPPHTGSAFSPQIQALVVALRRLLGWNEKRLAHELRQRHLAQISHASVGRIFARYHLPTRTYHTVAPRLGVPFQRYEAAAPNDQWHIDLLETKLADGQRVVILALIDDHSRYCVSCEVAEPTTDGACQALLHAIYRHGPPREVVSDNGSVFVGPAGATLYGRLLAHLGIRQRRIAPYWPQGNGKVEAFIKILKQEGLARSFASLPELHQALAAFVDYYNQVRLHSALAYQPPATRYLARPAPQGHGLAGIPGLPPALSQAFPPAQPLTAPPSGRAAHRFPLLCIHC
jgi:transposase InsO family protein